MKKFIILMLVLSLCVIVPLAITGYGYVADKTAEFVYQYAAPRKPLNIILQCPSPTIPCFWNTNTNMIQKGRRESKARSPSPSTAGMLSSKAWISDRNASSLPEAFLKKVFGSF